MDRAWWARVIRRADVVDLAFVRAQRGGRRIGTRAAVRAYVRGGFRRGLSLNPLFLEGLVSAQLPDAERVPALYAYLVGDPARIETTVAWSAPEHAERHPEALGGPGGPLGDAWRRVRAGGPLRLGGGDSAREVDGAALRRAAVAALSPQAPPAETDIGSAGAATARIDMALDRDDDDGRALAALATVLADIPATAVLHLHGTTAGLRAAAALLTLLRPGLAMTDAPLPEEGAEDEDEPARTEAEGTAGTDASPVLLRRESGAAVTAEVLLALLRAASEGPVEPLWLAADGTTASAGVVVHGGRGFPLLAGFPAEDARALGESIPSAAPQGPVRARRAGAARPGCSRAPRSPEARRPASCRSRAHRTRLSPRSAGGSSWTAGPPAGRSSSPARRPSLWPTAGPCRDCAGPSRPLPPPVPAARAGATRTSPEAWPPRWSGWASTPPSTPARRHDGPAARRAR